MVAGTPRYFLVRCVSGINGSLKSILKICITIKGKSVGVQSYTFNTRDITAVEGIKELLSACQIKNAGIGFVSEEFFNCSYNIIY